VAGALLAPATGSRRAPASASAQTEIEAIAEDDEREFVSHAGEAVRIHPGDVARRGTDV